MRSADDRACSDVAPPDFVILVFLDSGGEVICHDRRLELRSPAS